MTPEQSGYFIGQNLAYLAAALLVGWLAWRAVRAARARGAAPAVGGPAGFGGWFIVPLVGQTIAPLLRVFAVFSSAQAITQLSSIPNGALTIWGEIVWEAALAVLSIWVAIEMYRRSPRFPRLFMIQWIALVVFALFEPAIVALLLGVALSNVYSAKSIGGIVGTLVGGVWVLYMFRSVRVRNTFGPRAMADATAATFE